MNVITKYLGLTRANSPANDTTDRQERVLFDDSQERQARFLAERICSGFQLHDRRQREESVEAFYAVDRNQFAHLDNESALVAAEAFVDALWAKDDIEKSHQVDGVVDPVAIADADYDSVYQPLARRAEVVGMDVEYAEKTTEAWKKHKTSEDYWTAFLQAQTAELRAALGKPNYPNKPKEGSSGYGPLATRYVLAVELHDLHTSETWEEAIRVMTPYYQAILLAHQER